MEPLRFQLNWLYITCWRRLADVKLKQELIYWLESVLWSTYSYPKVRLAKPTYDYTISHEHESCCSRITKHDCFYTTDTVNKQELRLHYILDIIYWQLQYLVCFLLCQRKLLQTKLQRNVAHIWATPWCFAREWISFFEWTVSVELVIQWLITCFVPEWIGAFNSQLYSM